MKLNNKEINIFENDEQINNFCIKYYEIKKQFQKANYPPSESNYCKELKSRYNYELSIEEFYELKDYAENDYIVEIAEQIKSDYESGYITEINNI